MPDARHPKKYPGGSRYPKLPVTEAWKKLVLSRLEENRRAGREPGNKAELARIIGADKGGLNVMLHTDQPSYKYTRQICEVLSIDEPTVENPAIAPDEIDRTVADFKSLPYEEQIAMLPVLRANIDLARKRRPNGR